MRIWLAQQLRRLADWLAPLDGVRLVVPRDALYEHAVAIVAWVDRTQETASWQNKWHQASGTLTKAFPDRSPRDISRAIEAALQEAR